jgi:hypothetical protein
VDATVDQRDDRPVVTPGEDNRLLQKPAGERGAADLVAASGDVPLVLLDWCADTSGLLDSCLLSGAQ